MRWHEAPLVPLASAFAIGIATGAWIPAPAWWVLSAGALLLGLTALAPDPPLGHEPTLPAHLGCRALPPPRRAARCRGPAGKRLSRRAPMASFATPPGTVASALSGFCDSFGVL